MRLLRSLAEPLLFSLPLWALAGCETPPPPVPTDVPPRDGGMADSPDAPGVDAPVDGALDDATLPDAGTFACSVAEVLDVATDAAATDRVIGLAAGTSSFGLTWTQLVDGTAEVHVASVGASGAPTIRRHTSLGRTMREPAIVATSSGWLLSWVGNQDGGYEVYAQSVGADLMPVGSPNRLTTNTNLDSTPTLVPLPTSGYLAAWTEAASRNLALTRVLGGDGAPSGAARTVTTDANSVERPTLGMRSAGAVMVWGESGGAPPEARILALDAVGGGSGGIATASSEGNADGSADVTMDDLGGAMVFGVLVGGARSEVRLRLLDETGSLVESERAVTGSTGRDASIAAFGGGYLVSYRAADGATPVRLALLDPLGGFLREIDVADAEPTGGRTTVRVTTDGRILVAWADVTATGTRIRAARVQCD